MITRKVLPTEVKKKSFPKITAVLAAGIALSACSLPDSGNASITEQNIASSSGHSSAGRAGGLGSGGTSGIGGSHSSGGTPGQGGASGVAGLGSAGESAGGTSGIGGSDLAGYTGMAGSAGELGSGGTETGGETGTGGATGGTGGIIVTGGTAGATGGSAGSFTGGNAGEPITAGSSGQTGTGGSTGTGGATGGTGGIIVTGGTAGASGEAGASGSAGSSGEAGSQIGGSSGDGGSGGVATGGTGGSLPVCDDQASCVSAGVVGLVDPEFGAGYLEFQSAWTTSTAPFDSMALAKDFELYEISIIGPGAKQTGINVCYTETNGDYTACKPDNMRFATETHGMTIRIFGNDWTIVELDAPGGVLNNETQLAPGGSITITKLFDTITLTHGQPLEIDPGYMVALGWRNNDTRDTKPDSLHNIWIYKPICSDLLDQSC